MQEKEVGTKEHMKTNRESIKEIIEICGCDNQILIAIEEMSELTKELIKLRRNNSKDYTCVLEELSDVSLMLDQLKIIFGFKNEQINQIKKQKIKRTLKRLGNE